MSNPRAIKDIAGLRFGRFTVISRVENYKDGSARWLCRCDCGNERVVLGRVLRSGSHSSCGCGRIGKSKFNEDSERIERHSEKVPESGCWIWTGTTGKTGYGVVFIGKKSFSAHRFSYQIHRGDVPDGLELDHKCRVRCCVNPDHLEPVTHHENVRRGMVGVENRQKTHCPQGHPYDEKNTIVKKGSRHCRECKKIYLRARRKRA